MLRKSCEAKEKSHILKECFQWSETPHQRFLQPNVYSTIKNTFTKRRQFLWLLSFFGTLSKKGQAACYFAIFSPLTRKKNIFFSLIQTKNYFFLFMHIWSSWLGCRTEQQHLLNSTNNDDNFINFLLKLMKQCGLAVKKYWYELMYTAEEDN